MIDFRYHLVSIIAVFLALAVGLLVGSTALSGKAVEALQAAQRAAASNNAALAHDNSNLTGEVKADQTFAGAIAPLALNHLLTGYKVVLVAAPGDTSAVTTGVTTALKQAGAAVTGEVVLTNQFLLTSAANEEALTQLAGSLDGTAGVTLPANTSGQVAGQQAAAQVLAASLLDAGGAGLAPADSQHILSAFGQQGFVSIVNGASTITGPAQLAVLVTPNTPPPQTGSLVLMATAVALRNAGSGTVMAGAVPSVGQGSVISAENIAGKVSTVDDADTEIGQITTVQALRDLLDHKPPGKYGIGPDAAPSPAPTPTVTPTPGGSPSTGRHK